MMFKHIHYPESRFGGFTDIDGTIAFYIRVNSLLKPSFVVVDFGCGRGACRDDPILIRRELAILKGKVHKVIGLDVDPVAEQNPLIDEFHLLQSGEWPLEDNSADLCISDSVLEHLERPDSFFSQCRRVLRDEGYLCIRTANSWSYISLLGKLIPNKYHDLVLSKVQDKRKEVDVFPTLYRCNTIPKIRAMLSKCGFEHVVYGYEAEPSYLSFARVAYWLGTIHQRFAPGFMRPAIFAFAQVHK
ncbi:MAG: methyltransferase domain-containing protein [Acidobacteriota bacterium]